ncbi:MAG TPA: tetratricopeptide repeat protein [Anaerolineales bacterium]
MRQRRPRINWFLVVVVVILIAIVTYVDRFILPTVQTPFVATLTATRDPESYVTDAENLFAEGKLLQSIDTYMEAIRIKPDDPSIYIALARVQVFAGKYDEAQVNAENSLLLNPNNSMAHAVRAWALTQKGDYVAADNSLTEALRLDPSNGIIQAYKAFLYGKMSENNAGPTIDPMPVAIQASQAAVTLAPNSLEAHWARAYILQITTNGEQAIQEYLLAIQINPNISEIHLELGVTYKGLGVIDLALQQYTLANTLNPSDIRPYLYSSRALVSIGEYAKAVQYAESAVANDPTNPYLRGNWGFMLYKNNDWPNALIQLSLAVNGGTNEDGQTIQPQPLIGGDTRIAQYFSFYAILLAQSDRCGEALLITQLLVTNVPNDADAAYNVTYVEQLCEQKLGTPSSPRAGTGTTTQPAATPKATPTP